MPASYRYVHQHKPHETPEEPDRVQRLVATDDDAHKQYRRQEAHSGLPQVCLRQGQSRKSLFGLNQPVGRVRAFLPL